MLDYPLVSIGVASYNNAKYIIETLDSVYNQTYPKIELIIVDDFSKDNSVELIENWLLHKKIDYKFIKNKENLGLTKVCNLLLNEARGKYFSVLGSDDIYLEDKVKIQVDQFEKSGTETAVIYSDVYVIDEQGNLKESTFLSNNGFDINNLPSGKVFKELAIKSFIPAMSVLCKREYLIQVGGYDESLAYEDLDMWLKISLKFKIVNSLYISAKYRIHSKSLWSTRGLPFKLSDIRIMLKYLNHDKDVDKIFLNRLSFEIEDLYRQNGRKYVEFLKTNYKINKSFKNFILLLLGQMNIDLRVLDKLLYLIKLKFLIRN